MCRAPRTAPSIRRPHVAAWTFFAYPPASQFLPQLHHERRCAQRRGRHGGPLCTDHRAHASISVAHCLPRAWERPPPCTWTSRFRRRRRGWTFRMTGSILAAAANIHRKRMSERTKPLPVPSLPYPFPVSAAAPPAMLAPQEMVSLRTCSGTGQRMHASRARGGRAEVCAASSPRTAEPPVVVFLLYLSFFPIFIGILFVYPLFHFTFPYSSPIRCYFAVSPSAYMPITWISSSLRSDFRVASMYVSGIYSRPLHVAYLFTCTPQLSI
ncbi:hypothetical protein B0H19DRAFT_1122823 [Mycena capillaripes]|nr:hypothetical protein B0H19DRAFT_1122823 [Mycena capillaripes]